MSDVTVVIGAGQIGQAIARRVSAGKHVLLATSMPISLPSGGTHFESWPRRSAGAGAAPG